MDGPPVSSLAAIVLAGGHSSRMGMPKALIDWHGSPLVTRIARLLQRVADPVVVVRAAGADPVPLPDGAEPATDARPGLGPVEGIAAGMRRLAGRATAAFVCAADLPLLHPDFVRGVAAFLDGHDVVLPVWGGHEQPLAAVYRTSLLAQIERVLAAGLLRPSCVWEHARVRRLEADELVEEASLRGVNTPAELAELRALPAPLVRVAVRRPGRPAAAVPIRLRAASLGEAVAALPADLVPACAPSVALNGAPTPFDPQLPLVAGDTVTLVMPC